MKKKTIITVLLAIVAVIVVKKGVSYIYDKIQIMNALTMQEIVEANPWTVPADWFKTDTITIKGRIEDYDAERFGFSSMACYYNDVFAKNSTVLVLDIADDGTFCKKFQASYPVWNSFIADESKVRFNAIHFFARPGETIDITVQKGTFGRYECVYNNGSSRDVERLLHTSSKLEDVMRPLWKFEGTFDEANEVADEVWKRAMAKLQKVARSEDYTPMEVQLALADIEARFGMDYIGCIERIADGLVKHEQRDSVWHTEILDSVEWKKYLDYETYVPMRRIDYDNPLLFASSSYYFLQNRIQYAKPVREGQYEGLLNEEGGMEATFEKHSKKLANELADTSSTLGAKMAIGFKTCSPTPPSLRPRKRKTLRNGRRSPRCFRSTSKPFRTPTSASGQSNSATADCRKKTSPRRCPKFLRLNLSARSSPNSPAVSSSSTSGA